jgi:RNA polymerase sigma-70 factor (ECF subfamily)
MRKTPAGGPWRDLATIFGTDTTAGHLDAELVERFANRRDEVAFEALVARHGPMVLATCRRMLRDPADADDAFQATFLVLARRAGSIRVGATLGPWLHGVAVRVAIRARSRAAVRQSREVSGVDLPDRPVAAPPLDDLQSVIDEELCRLPARYRDAVVLCLLEGLTHDEAAARLGCPSGTVKSRLSRGRALLKDRLARRDLAPAEIATAAWFGRPAVPAALSAAATRLSTIDMLAGTVPAGVALLGNGVLMSMTMAKLTVVASSLLAAGLLAVGIASAALNGRPGAPASQGPGTLVEGQAAQSPSPDAPRSNQRERYEELRREFDTKMETTSKSLREALAKDDENSVNAASDDRQDLKLEYAPRFLALRVCPISHVQAARA